MQKLTILFIILLFVSCNKTDNKAPETTPTVAVSDTLTEAEAWRLFDEFWVKFQSVVVNEDNSDYDYFKDCIKRTNKSNGYNDSVMNKYVNSNYIYNGYKKVMIKYYNEYEHNKVKENNIFIICMYAQAREQIFCGYDKSYKTVIVGLRNKKYEIIGFEDYGIFE